MIGDRLNDIVDRLAGASAIERLLISGGALVMSVLIGGVIVFISGVAGDCSTGLELFGQTFCYNPLEVYYELFLGALGHPLEAGWQPQNFRLARTLQRTTLLSLTGLSVAIAFRAGLFNIGTQGQLVLGGLATAVVVPAVAGPAPAGIAGMLVLVPVGVLIGAAVGGVWGALPGVLKAYADANEVITTIMLNFVATGIAATLLSWRFQDPNSNNPQTSPLPEYATVPNVPAIGFDPQQGFSLFALVFALALAAAIAWMLTQTAFGYSLRVSGVQPAAAAYGGVEGKQMVVASMTLSGAVGGVAGAVWVLMVHGRWLESVPALGFDGIAVSVLAGNSPLGVGAAAFLFGLLDSGTGAVQSGTSVPPDLVGIISGLVVLFVAMPEFFRLLGRYTQLGTRDEGAVATDGGTELPPTGTATAGTDSPIVNQSQDYDQDQASAHSDSETATEPPADTDTDTDDGEPTKATTPTTQTQTQTQSCSSETTGKSK